MHGAQCRHYGRNIVKIRLRFRAVDMSEARAMGNLVSMKEEKCQIPPLNDKTTHLR